MMVGAALVAALGLTTGFTTACGSNHETACPTAKDSTWLKVIDNALKSSGRAVQEEHVFGKCNDSSSRTTVTVTLAEFVDNCPTLVMQLTKGDNQQEIGKLYPEYKVSCQGKYLEFDSGVE